MHSLKNIIQHCHKRHQKPLQQRETVVTPAIHKGLYSHFTAYCARRHLVRLYDLEEVGISFMPVGRALKYDRVPQSFGGERFLRRQGTGDWDSKQWNTSWGIRVYTGIPSEREGARWHDLHFTYASICAAPDAVLTCIETLIDVVAHPLLTLTKSGGLRFSCRVPDYLHPNTEEARFYIYKDTPNQRDVYLEICGEEGHSPWDARYEILLGDLLNPPVIAKEVFFASIDALREALHEPNPRQTETPKSPPVEVLSLPSLGSYKLDLAREAFLRYGFFYLREENGFHHWTQQVSENGDTDVLLWERDSTVWIRAVTPDVGLPTEDTPITDVWEDTGILPSMPATGLPVSEKVPAIREGVLSPLAIKRPSPVLQKPEGTEKVYVPLEESITEIERALETDARVIGLTGETGARNDYTIEAHLLKGGSTCFNTDYHILDEAVQHFEKQDLPATVRYRSHGFRWDQVKDIPVDVRMANPFVHGNVCEDAERCLALEAKGIDSSKGICPECPVWTTCQARGYLSQPAALQRAETQIIGNYWMFLNPYYSAKAAEILEPKDNSERLCIIDEMRTENLFLGHGISRAVLAAWRVRWQGSALGRFANALLNALEIRSESDDIVVKRIRTVTQAFQPYEAEIVRQLGQINVKCKIVAQETVDDETGEALARWTVNFEGGVSAYIPLNDAAADRLTAKGLLVFHLDSFVPDEDMRVPMSAEQAIQFGILDTETVEQIQEFPRVYRDPDWTFWHQLKRFFAHYTRNADAPMIWHNNCLTFGVPPVLHPSVKRFLLMSSTLTARDFRKIFPNEAIEAIHLKPTPWVKGNRVFQIRTGVHTFRTILNHDSNWSVVGLSETAERFLLGISAEIDRDPSVKHAILTYDTVIEQLREVAGKENVCLVTELKDLRNLEAAFEAAEVVWIVGTPYWDPALMWKRAQLLFGSDEEPLSYEAEAEFQHYKDERVQKVYIQAVAELVTEIIGRAGLNRWKNKKVVLISSLEIPNVTDRPETLLFDWEDFEAAGSLDKLAEMIAVRERFEAEREQITVETPRAEVERILGCSSRQANRLLNKLRGGNRPTFREQILSMLADGEKKAAEMVEAIDGTSKAVYREFARLVELGEIEKVRWGVYRLPKKQ